ncbi:MAG: HDOD domain-containing protein [Magnetococcales bacterium]|nr:HDOD domain-containing protein [Magnetococcales bacterium]
MNATSRERAMVANTHLPLSPRVLLEIWEAMSSLLIDFPQVLDRMSRQLPLAERLLREAHRLAPRHGVERISIPQAGTLLGPENLRQAVVRWLLLAPLHRNPLWDRVQQEALALGETTRTLALLLMRQSPWWRSSRFPQLDPDFYFMAGLFRECGQWVLWQQVPGYRLPFRHSPGDGSAILLDETTRFGTNHARLGSLFAKSLGLPAHLCRAIRNHHHPLPDWTADQPAGHLKELFLAAILRLGDRVHSAEPLDTVHLKTPCRLFQLEQKELSALLDEARHRLPSSSP